MISELEKKKNCNSGLSGLSKISQDSCFQRLDHITAFFQQVSVKRPGPKVIKLEFQLNLHLSHLIGQVVSLSWFLTNQVAEFKIDLGVKFYNL